MFTCKTHYLLSRGGGIRTHTVGILSPTLPVRERPLLFGNPHKYREFVRFLSSIVRGCSWYIGVPTGVVTVFRLPRARRVFCEQSLMCPPISLVKPGAAYVPPRGNAALALVFVAGWTVMVVAMMLPTSLPLITLFRTLVSAA